MSKADLIVDCLSFNIGVVEDNIKALADSETRFVKPELKEIVLEGQKVARTGYDRAIIEQGSGDVVYANGTTQKGPGRKRLDVAPRRDQGERIKTVRRLSKDKRFGGSDSISISIDPFNNGGDYGYILTAVGRPLFFYEFGIGYFVDAGEGDYAAQARRQGASIKSGSWSRTKHVDQFGRQTPGPFWVHGLWHYRGKIYHGEFGSHAMYEAERLMRSKIDKLVAKR